jgi:alkaline phosphatase D
VADAVRELDGEIGKLMDGIKESRLPVDFIVLADHGMVEVKGAPIHLDQYGLNVSWMVTTVGSSLYAKSEEDAQRAYGAMRGKSDKFVVYRRAKVPADLQFDSNAREGDPVVVPTGPYVITATADLNAPEHPPAGMHGYDVAYMPEMKAIFVASGPDIRAGVALQPFENINVYPLIAKILGLDIANLKTGAIDGRLSVLEGILKEK